MSVGTMDRTAPAAISAFTLDALAASTSNVGRASAAIDNSTTKYPAVDIQAKIVSGTGTPGGEKYVYLYLYEALDGSSPNYTEGVTGSDAAYTIARPQNFRLIGAIFVDTASTTYWSKTFSDIYVPAKWGVVAVNNTNMALGTGCLVNWSGLKPTFT